ncbi:hypothetical protein KCU77_g16774, partial [Aureobasidium melanogenum]
LQDRSTAEEAHERCVRLLIVELSSAEIVNDTAVLCAIVILRVFEQLNVAETGTDAEHHLSGSSALLSKSQGYTIDPASPGLREAAFWIYVRQCLYNACVFQQQPNIDLHHELSPIPHSWDGSSRLRSETAWANNITWICVTIVHFCFGKDSNEPSTRMLKWQELSILLESWRNTRPDTFDPIWQSAEPTDNCPFPEIRFVADWHLMAFGFYSLCCMLLLIYKPAPRFAIRRVQRRMSQTDTAVIGHARALCGACWYAPDTVPSSITLCHTAFIWGPLMIDRTEQEGVIKLLERMEHRDKWPTAWIVASLKEEWSIT